MNKVEVYFNLLTAPQDLPWSGSIILHDCRRLKAAFTHRWCLDNHGIYVLNYSSTLPSSFHASTLKKKGISFSLPSHLLIWILRIDSILRNSTMSIYTFPMFFHNFLNLEFFFLNLSLSRLTPIFIEVTPRKQRYFKSDYPFWHQKN